MKKLSSSSGDNHSTKSKVPLSETQIKLYEFLGAVLSMSILAIFLRACAWSEYSEEYDIKKDGDICVLRVNGSYHGSWKPSSYQNTITDYSWSMGSQVEDIILAKQHVRWYNPPIRSDVAKIISYANGSYEYDKNYTGILWNLNNPVLQNCEFEYKHLPDLCKVASIWGICDITEHTKNLIGRIKDWNSATLRSSWNYQPLNHDVVWGKGIFPYFRDHPTSEVNHIKRRQKTIQQVALDGNVDLDDIDKLPKDYRLWEYIWPTIVSLKEIAWNSKIHREPVGMDQFYAPPYIDEEAAQKYIDRGFFTKEEMWELMKPVKERIAVWKRNKYFQNPRERKLNQNLLLTKGAVIFQDVTIYFITDPWMESLQKNGNWTDTAKSQILTTIPITLWFNKEFNLSGDMHVTFKKNGDIIFVSEWEKYVVKKELYKKVSMSNETRDVIQKEIFIDMDENSFVK